MSGDPRDPGVQEITRILLQSTIYTSFFRSVLNWVDFRAVFKTFSVEGPTTKRDWHYDIRRIENVLQPFTEVYIFGSPIPEYL